MAQKPGEIINDKQMQVGEREPAGRQEMSCGQEEEVEWKEENRGLQRKDRRNTKQKGIQIRNNTSYGKVKIKQKHTEKQSTNNLAERDNTVAQNMKNLQCKHKQNPKKT